VLRQHDELCSRDLASLELGRPVALQHRELPDRLELGDPADPAKANERRELCRAAAAPEKKKAQQIEALRRP